MDPFLITVFVFVLLLTMMVGGFVFLYPLSRRLAAWADVQIENRRGNPEGQAELQELRESVQRLEAEVGKLSERQAFTESLVAGEKAKRLADPTGGGDRVDPA